MIKTLFNSILVANAGFYLFLGIWEPLTIPTFPLMTLYTSLSLWMLSLFLHCKDQNRPIYAGLIFLLQGVSVFQLLAKSFSSHAYLLPSSWVTIVLIIVMTFCLSLRTENLFHRCLSYYLYQSCAFITLVGLWGHFTEDHSLLTQSRDSYGIGLSLITIICSMLLLSLISLRMEEEGHHYMKIKAFFHSYKFFYYQVFGTIALGIFLNKLTLFHPLINLAISSVLSFFLGYLLLRQKFQEIQEEEKIVMCSWKKTFRPEFYEGANFDKEEWVHVEKFLQQKGFFVSHGISPLAYKEISKRFK